MTGENDIILIYYEDQPVLFARIEEIAPDHKKNWYHVRLLPLSVPLQTVTWILKDIYIDGKDFTMDGKKIRLEKVIAPNQESPSSGKTKTKANHQSDKLADALADAPAGGKIIPLADRKPKA